MYRSAPEIKTPTSTKKKPLKKPAQSSTPVVLKRRLTLPKPKNSIQLSPIKTIPDDQNSATKPAPSEIEAVPAKKAICLPEITSPAEAGIAPGLIPPGMDLPKGESSVIQNRSFTDTDQVPDPEGPPGDSTQEDDFDLDETDDDLMSKFLSLKKKFGRSDQGLSDSLVVNTSVRDAIGDAIGDAIVSGPEEQDDSLTSNKKFKMEIHNELDSTDS